MTILTAQQPRLEWKLQIAYLVPLHFSEIRYHNLAYLWAKPHKVLQTVFPTLSGQWKYHYELNLLLIFPLDSYDVWSLVPIPLIFCHISFPFNPTIDSISNSVSHRYLSLAFLNFYQTETDILCMRSPYHI